MSRFVDEADITVKSGNGGAGCVSFRREKYVPRGGPDGGDGGDGGDIIFKVKKELRSLYPLKLKRLLKAQNGIPGSGKNRHGARGKDCIIYVPAGTVILERQSKRILADLTEQGYEFVLLKGGRGGKGNSQFATSTNRAPRYAQRGRPGKELSLALQIKIIADVGIVGLPNVGKSTLLSVLTDARPKIGDYPFTTLTPNLGVMTFGDEREFILADLPGLIEGASKGHGLGIQFLKHIERTKALLILIDLSNVNYYGQYETILLEMKSYSPKLLEKPRFIVGSKRDIVNEEQDRAFQQMEIPGRKLCISSIARMGLDSLKDEIAALMGSLDEGSLS